MTGIYPVWMLFDQLLFDQLLFDQLLFDQLLFDQRRVIVASWGECLRRVLRDGSVSVSSTKLA